MFQAAVLGARHSDHRALDLVSQHHVRMVELVVRHGRIAPADLGLRRGRKILRRRNEGLHALDRPGNGGIQVDAHEQVAAAARRQVRPVLQLPEPVNVAGHHHAHARRRQVGLHPQRDVENQVLLLQPVPALGTGILAPVPGIQHHRARAARAQIGRRPHQRIHRILRVRVADRPVAAHLDHRHVQPDLAAVEHRLAAVRRELQAGVLPADQQRLPAGQGQRQTVHRRQVLQRHVALADIGHRLQRAYLRRRRHGRGQAQDRRQRQTHSNGTQSMHEPRILRQASAKGNLSIAPPPRSFTCARNPEILSCPAS